MIVVKNPLKNTVNRTMKLSKYLIGVWTAVAIYALFSILNGPKGLSAYNQLLSEREQQLANIKELGYINEELENTKNNLLYDHDTLLVHARQMGYAHEDERFIRIVGLERINSSPAITGKIYITKEPDFFSDKIIKIISICAGLLIFSFLLMFELIEAYTARSQNKN
ncbi:MAG: septum formation initiator family protein [Treponema sp.]|nr:septum formation initiator family protein [Treponema sp.]